MKALILAAGKGSRIQHVSQGLPKSMLPLGDETLISHSLNLLKKKGIKEIVVVTGYKRQQLMKHISGVWGDDVDYIFNPHYSTTNVLYSFWLGLKKIEDKDFIFLHADTVFSEDILEKVMLTKMDQSGLLIAIDKHKCDDEAMKVSLNNRGFVVNITKEMSLDECSGEFIGLAKISKRICSQLNESAEKVLEEGLFQSYFEYCIQRLINEKELPVQSCDITGLAWREVDFEEDYIAALKMF